MLYDRIRKAIRYRRKKKGIGRYRDLPNNVLYRRYGLACIGMGRIEIAGRNALGRRQEESGMLEKGTYRLMWQGMEKCYGEPKWARSWKQPDTAKATPKVTRHSLTLHPTYGILEGVLETGCTSE